MGYEFITNMDFSKNLVEQLTVTNEPFENMDTVCIDITKIDWNESGPGTVEEDSYDLIIDKGCLDCVLCDQDPSKGLSAIENVHKLLTRGGIFFLITRGSPQMRMHLFESQDTDDIPDASEVGEDDDETQKNLFAQSDRIDKSKWNQIQIYSLQA